MIEKPHALASKGEPAAKTPGPGSFLSGQEAQCPAAATHWRGKEPACSRIPAPRRRSPARRPCCSREAGSAKAGQSLSSLCPASQALLGPMAVRAPRQLLSVQTLPPWDIRHHTSCFRLESSWVSHVQRKGVRPCASYSHCSSSLERGPCCHAIGHCGCRRTQPSFAVDFCTQAAAIGSNRRQAAPAEETWAPEREEGELALDGVTPRIHFP